MLRSWFLLIFLASTPVAAMELFHPPAPIREFHYFNGTGFDKHAGSTGSPAVSTRDGYFPHVSAGQNTGEKKLPPDTGVVTGICYIQVSGGKLTPQAGSIPAEGVQVVARQGSSVHSTVTDASGFFVFPVPAGEYLVEAAGVSREVTVKRGKTSLTALRCGKRMRD